MSRKAMNAQAAGDKKVIQSGQKISVTPKNPNKPTAKAGGGCC